MADFTVQTPCAGFLPLTMGDLRLTEVVPARMTSLAPYLGSAGALSAALLAAHGVAWPEPGRVAGQEAARMLWFGRELALLIGPAPDASLAAHAALTDQSDGWAVVQLEGRQAVKVLARLCPLDLRDAVFAPGQTARTDVAHMAGSVSRLGPQTWQIMVFRSMAATLVHEVEIAMARVAARQNSPM